jgi:hypothetical protein
MTTDYRPLGVRETGESRADYVALLTLGDLFADLGLDVDNWGDV